MNYVNFMRKLEGKEPQHEQQTTNSTTSGARPLDLQGIIEFARGLGYSECNLEARPEIPTDHRVDLFWAGYNGYPSFRSAMGMYSRNSSCFYWVGYRYQQQQGDTHSQQQDAVPVETPRGNGGSDWIVNGDDVNLDEIRAITRRLERLTMGSPSTSSQPRAEPEGGVDWRVELYADQREYERTLRSTLGPEGFGVSSVRDERESSERSAEDTERSNRYRMERSTGWSFR
jgi:hypothetical protein